MSLIRKIIRSKKKHRHYKEPDYIESIKEWQDHQYIDGYYTGGRMPHYLFDRDTSAYGLILTVSGGMTLLLGLLSCISDGSPFGYAILGFGALQFVAGMRRSYKKKVKAKVEIRKHSR